MTETKSMQALQVQLEKAEQRIQCIKAKQRKLKQQARDKFYRQVGRQVVQQTGIKAVAELTDWQLMPILKLPGEQEFQEFADTPVVPSQYATVSEIKSYLDQQGITYRPTQSKSELLALLP